MKSLWRFGAFFMAAILAVTLAGCAGTAAPVDTVGKGIIVSEATVGAVRSTAAKLLIAGKIDKAAAQGVLDKTDAIEADIALAETLKPSDPAAAQSMLTKATTGLQVLRSYLISQGAKP